MMTVAPSPAPRVLVGITLAVFAHSLCLGAPQETVRPAAADAPRIGTIETVPNGGDIRDGSAGLRLLPANVRVTRLGGQVAGEVLPGQLVFQNVSDDPTLFIPGPGIRIAEKLYLRSGGELKHFSVQVFGTNASAAPTFDVVMSIWDGDPCDLNSEMLYTTTVQSVPNDGTIVELEDTPGTRVVIPDLIYLEMVFNGPGAADAGWLVGEIAEVGFAPNYWLNASQCQKFQFQGGCGAAYAGYWATVRVQAPAARVGACCEGDACSEVRESLCTGIWHGPGSTCVPSPCASGVCCTGALFDACAPSTGLACQDGFFHPNVTCDADPCGPVHATYANTFRVNGFHRSSAGALRADDLYLKTDGPRELAGYELLVAGNGIDGPERFSATLELWTNISTDPNREVDDVPFEPIPGTRAIFSDIPADGCPQRLVVGVPTNTPIAGGAPVIVPPKIWLAISTDSDYAGPFLGGPAKLGRSPDNFAEFDTDLAPGEWLGDFGFQGFNPQGCPDGVNCVPAGSFRTIVYLAGPRPTGACCDEVAGMCTDGVTEMDCSGRWAGNATCDSTPFDPPCGHNACCRINELNPTNPLICSNRSREQCAAANGIFSPGLKCDETQCPMNECLGATGDCFAEGGNGTPGCDDGYCCGLVCAVDDFCCTVFDDVCAEKARSLCRPLANDAYEQADAIGAVSGGANTIIQVDFDNTEATQVGPSHRDCATLGDIDGFNSDLWYCWQSPCTGLVTVETCDLTDVDTKIAVYEGCEGPPNDANLWACDDDRCGFQSSINFGTNEGSQYLIRVASAPGITDGGNEFPVSAVGTGRFRVTCEDVSNPACPGNGSCCDVAGTGTPGCDDTLCCSLVCNCDSFCCDSEWDTACATTGFGDSGCGAELLCRNQCAFNCPSGAITWTAPLDGTVDARSDQSLGLDVLEVQGPSDADAECWTVCEGPPGSDNNSVASVIESPAAGTASHYTLILHRALTPGASMIMTYRDNGGLAQTGTFHAHPGNVNGDATADAGDVAALVQALAGTDPGIHTPWGLYSGDTDHSGRMAPPDIIAVIDLLNAGWSGTAVPTPGSACTP